MTVWASTLADASAALVAMCQGIPLDGEVRDGPQVGDAAAKEVIIIGHVTPEDDAAAEGDFAPGDQGGSSQEETYAIHNALAVLLGNKADAETVAAGRARVVALHAAVGAVVAADRKLQGTVMHAGMGAWTLREDNSTGGYRAELRFAVNVRAFTKRV